jgi:calcium permeable stress-gated cation channel
LINQHDHLVRKLEKVLAKYLKNPAQLPAAKPTCRPSKKDPSYGTYPKGQKVDAIEYLTQRIKVLEFEIKEVRKGVDKRSSMSYGFASYSDIAEAHNIAYVCRKKKPHGATITLAPRPNDIIWDNMPLAPSVRSWKRIINNLWVALLTLIWIAPNAMIAIFLVNLSNLGRVWPAFQTSLEQSTTFWGVVQGIASPALTSLVYLILPTIFRRMSIQAGDRTKTGRERHVLAKLYSFFVFNNLVVFSIFSTVWQFVAGVVYETSQGSDFWKAVVKENLATTLFISLCNISPFWITWLLQRQLGAAIDLAQLWTLIYSFFMRKFGSPSPRELIELTAPPPFDYASYYNYFLFYSTVTLCYSGIQPLVLPAAALYFVIDVFLKKYLILYVFVTKTESGGMFWRVLFNRFVFGTILADLVFFLTCWVRGEGTHMQAFAVVPLPFLMVGFKLYCARAFDDKIHFFSTRNVPRHPEQGQDKEQLRSDRLASKFGHPVLYKPLITPMVHQKAQNILHTVYKGRLSDGREAGSGDTMSVSGYSDTFALDPMHAGKPGKSAAVSGFEFVPESQLDFEFYKNRSEFAAEHGGGEIFGRPSDFVRPGTPGSTIADSEFGGSRPGSPALGGMTGGITGNRRVFSHTSHSEPSSAYQPYRPNLPGYMSPPQSGYMSPPQSGFPQSGFAQQATVGSDIPARVRSPLYAVGHHNGSETSLVRNAAGVPVATPGSGPGSVAGSREVSIERHRSPGLSHVALGGGPRGYSGLAQEEADLASDPSQYDYFRGGSARSRMPGQGGW